MNRAKREIKTPKRFDDEPFETPRSRPQQIIKQQPTKQESAKQQPAKQQPTKQQPTKQTPAKQTPARQQTPEPAKSIIKVKLTRTKRTPTTAPPETPSVPRAPEPVTPAEVISAPRPKRERPRTPPAFADLIPNVVLPFWDARTAAEDHEDDNVKELVHCHCGIIEELGLMVQCETCLTWQHASCLGIERAEEAPDGYTCQACSDPKFVRESKRWAYDQDWILKGRMKQFSCDPNPIPESKVKILQQINQLIADTLRIYQLIHSLRVKSRILVDSKDDDPELKLFRVQWPASYQHRDGTQFIPTINQPSSTPASTISVIGETPDPGDIPVETVVEAALPDIGQLEDVSAILDNTDIPNASIQPMVTSQEATPNDCRANLKLHIQQTEEFIRTELSQIEEQLAALEKECVSDKSGNLKTSFESLKNDLHSMRKYIR